eukprot:COSAG02_NODE_44965_length_361_cov_0.984733_1_plen_55_part_10
MYDVCVCILWMFTRFKFGDQQAHSGPSLPSPLRSFATFARARVSSSVRVYGMSAL